MSVAPSAAVIQQAVNDLPGADVNTRVMQQSALSAFGDAGARSAGASGLSNDFRKGYELALQVAREVIAANSLVIQFNIDPTQIL